MTLGKLINRLEACNAKAVVEFDFCGCIPTSLSSWRGIYADLALGWDASDRTAPVDVEDLLALLKLAIGKTYTGYKGGKFLMGTGTDVWVDNYGEYTNTAITGVIEDGETRVIIETRRQF